MVILSADLRQSSKWDPVPHRFHCRRWYCLPLFLPACSCSPLFFAVCLMISRLHTQKLVLSWKFVNIFNFFFFFFFRNSFSSLNYFFLVSYYTRLPSFASHSSAFCLCTSSHCICFCLYTRLPQADHPRIGTRSERGCSICTSFLLPVPIFVVNLFHTYFKFSSLIT